jgi:hypothetical protein
MLQPNSFCWPVDRKRLKKISRGGGVDGLQGLIHGILCVCVCIYIPTRCLYSHTHIHTQIGIGYALPAFSGEEGRQGKEGKEARKSGEEGRVARRRISDEGPTPMPTPPSPTPMPTPPSRDCFSPDPVEGQVCVERVYVCGCGVWCVSVLFSHLPTYLFKSVSVSVSVSLLPPTLVCV